ncbi:CDP-glucose 4,6-dehydratase [Propionispira arboris]|uniref:CDP-glucose 4,6-dehydratase n=1 Tax=Propionispira arboris TaxID=84035 RepID=A0A1H7CM50_9FIRM|nr:CDP-glucose 4,6-dehydratase [Propionispira arboris]SEJ87770.1 CDP-glucose 4,6-dehydratase [Propionispira arboris]
MNKTFWQGKKVFVTGHTGFKGAWLCLLLKYLGAEITGYSLKPPTVPSLFEISHIRTSLHSIEGDIRDLPSLQRALLLTKPEIVIHMAAQSLVRVSYKTPVETYATNVMGTVNLLEAVRHTDGVRAVLNVTTDKCYENKEWLWGYREDDSMGGYDPYSNSKACSELVTAAYRNSFFSSSDYKKSGIAIATARAGNVIGGGDWAKDRLIPDCLHNLLEKRCIVLRNPNAVRPWQHVLEPLNGYLSLAEKLYTEGIDYAEGWNFGPNEVDIRNVEWIVKKLCELWGGAADYQLEDEKQPHEAAFLKLDCSKAYARLNWRSRWHIEDGLEKIVDWVKAYKNGENMERVCIKQIMEYESAKKWE